MGITEHARSGYHRNRRSGSAPGELLGEDAAARTDAQHGHARRMHADTLTLAYAANGVYHIENTFANPVFVVLYLIWLGALWFHLTHGFWSSMQTLGWNNKTWISRWQCISNIYSTIVVLCFALVVVVFFIKSLM